MKRTYTDTKGKEITFEEEKEKEANVEYKILFLLMRDDVRDFERL